MIAEKIQIPPAHQILDRWLPEPFDEVLKAHTAQALRAFLYLEFVPRSLMPTN